MPFVPLQSLEPLTPLMPLCRPQAGYLYLAFTISLIVLTIPSVIKSALPDKLFLGTLFYKIIGYPESPYFGTVSVIAHEFNYSTAESSFENAILNCDYFSEIS